MSVSVKVRADIDRDAWNIWQACNTVSHGTDWKKSASPKLLALVFGKSETEAKIGLRPYLEAKHRELGLAKKAEDLERELVDIFPRVIKTLEDVTGHPIYRPDFVLFLTTFPRSPYAWPDGYIWLIQHKDINDHINTLMHELLHFQFMQYCGEKVWDAVGKEKYNAIKEGMVVILNDYLKDWTGIEEKTYPIYESLAQKLYQAWHGGANKNFDKFVDIAIELVRVE